ncbi:hypothetical protein PanWU01x14_354010 [Parasponia andersonii]|uniref:Uncharacterized protein n=1 Tax=Parasponia andersonii TaxID=3476 RepID=A0A2P5A9T5_PARAD|nr:hypothetical protein PanWU01x14_354010 [Parasponia andersonii]
MSSDGAELLRRRGRRCCYADEAELLRGRGSVAGHCWAAFQAGVTRRRARLMPRGWRLGCCERREESCDRERAADLAQVA